MTARQALVWRDNRVVSSEEATTPVMSHALHYGTTVFEGVRSYEGDLGTALFRLDDHLARLTRSAAAYRMPVPVPGETMRRAVHEVVRACGGGDVYVRPLMFRGTGSMSLDPYAGDVEFAVAGWRLDDYFATGERSGGMAGVAATISTWHRISPTALVPRAKAAGHYLNSVLAKADARERGFDEAILRDERGLVCEASAMNVFAVRGRTLATPATGPYLLAGITRDTVCRLATDLGLDVVEGELSVDGLLAADEVMLTGTGARIVPVRRLDDRQFPAPGPVTASLMEHFDAVVRGRVPDYHHWLDQVELSGAPQEWSCPRA